MYTKKILLLAVSVFLCGHIHAQYSTYDFELLQFVAGGGSSSTSPADVATAQNELAIRYFKGTGGAQKNYEKAVYWYTKSANNGNRYAQNNLAYAYLNGNGTPVDTLKALYWFEQSGNQHYHNAALMAGKMYYYGDGTPVNYNKAARLFKDAAFGDIPEGMCRYAMCFACGHGVQVDSTKAILWAKRAIDKGYNLTYWLLGNMYAEGLAVKKDDRAAKYYYEKGDDLNVYGCQNELGVAYATGSFVEKDMDKAMNYYLKAANNGSTVAMSNLASNYSRKDSGFYDPSQAVVWYRKLVDCGNEKFVDYLIDLYEEMGDFRDAIMLYEKQASQGNTSALNQLAYIYAQGKGVNKDYDKALLYIEKAISLAPDDMDYQDSKGEILVMKGDIKKAKKVWKLINTYQPFYYQNWIKEYGHEPPFYSYMKANGN